jgi:hypothetical protein
MPIGRKESDGGSNDGNADTYVGGRVKIVKQFLWIRGEFGGVILKIETVFGFWEADPPTCFSGMNSI